MSKITDFLKLKLFDGADKLDYKVINANMEKVDESVGMISDAWNGSTTYSVGSYCIYNNKLWKCKVQHSNQTPAEGTYWTETHVDDEFGALNQSLSSFENRIAYTGGLTPSTTDKTTIVKFPEGFTPRNCVPLCCWVAINDNFCGSLEGYKWGTMTFSKDEIRVQVNDSGATNKIFTVVLLRLT